MKDRTGETYTAFQGSRIVAAGSLRQIAVKAKPLAQGMPILVFSDVTGSTVELDFRGTVDEIVAKAPIRPAPDEEVEQRGPGRPKLGVVPREVTLLPRHWEWLNAQRGGASAALRRLVDEARRQSSGADAKRQAQEAAHRFLSAMAGDLPGYEEALRALYRGNREGFETQTKNWPTDVRNHARRFAAAAMAHE